MENFKMMENIKTDRWGNYVPGEDYLIHHGILGQKWGVRRYQNEDGSYTAAGKIHRMKENAKSFYDKKFGSGRYRDDKGKLTSSGRARYNEDGSRKNPKKMSTFDLKRSNERLNEESKYRSLTGRSQFSNGKTIDTLVKAGASFVASSTSLLAINALTNNSIGTGKTLVKKMMITGLAASTITVAKSFGGSNESFNKNKKG